MGIIRVIRVIISALLFMLYYRLQCLLFYHFATYLCNPKYTVSNISISHLKHP